MLTPGNRTITIAPGGTVLVGRTTAIGGGGGGTVPAYIAASTIMAKGLVPNSANGPAGLNDYSGWVYAEGKFINPGFYGHQDGSYNGIDGIDVTVNAPTGWVNLCPATPVNQRVSDSDYYADGPGNAYPGKPTACHGYHTGVYVASKRQIWRMGMRFSWSDPAIQNSSTIARPHIDAWDIATGQWLPKGSIPDLPAHNGGAVVNNAGFILSGNLGFITDPATGITTTRTGGSGTASRYPQANNPDDNYILNFTCGDGGEGSTSPVAASYLVGNVLTNLVINASAALTQLQADNAFAPGLTWCKPLNKWLFYHGGAGRENTIYALAVDRTANTVDVSILTITGGSLPTRGGGGVMSKFTYVDALGALFICTDVAVGINFVRIV